MTDGPGGIGAPGGRGDAQPGNPFPRQLLAGDTLVAARALLGAHLVRDPLPDAAGGVARGMAETRVGRIVEVEAYIGEADRASHARMGPTSRNRVMFGPPGIAYVYLVYGMHHCLNVVTEQAARPAAVLIRAIEPLAGITTMRKARERGRHRRAPVADARLAAGPALLAAAFDIDRSHTGLDLCDPASPLRLEAAPAGEPAPDVVTTPRVGIPFAVEPWASVPWRFLVPTSASLSGDPARRAADRRAARTG